MGPAVMNELRLLLRSPAQLWTLLLLAGVTLAALWLGSAEVQRQNAAIERFLVLDQQDRDALASSYIDAGGAAYGNFHATWNPPSDSAFLALGQRDVSPWLLRIRALALEGQINEAEDYNPVLALAGRFDFAFVVAFVLPLFVILLLYDMIAAEREAGRLPLLVTTARAPRRLWRNRAIVRIAGLALALCLPLWLAGSVLGANPGALLRATGVVLLALGFWSALTLALAARDWASPVIATALAGLWLVIAILVPLFSKLLVDRWEPGVDGAAIALLQRETVNGAWDLPKEATFKPFYATHPEWSDSPPVTTPFHWKWYYAFQQVGDQAAAPLSSAYRAAIARRDLLTGRLSWLSPPVAVLRTLQRIADTDVQSALAYEAQVRDYHRQLRTFYYPYLFGDAVFTNEALRDLPRFQPVR